MRNTLGAVLVASVILIATSCEQGEAPEFRRIGDVVSFSGYDWDVKQSEILAGPGPNYFSGDEDDIYLDDNGYLHMRIAERDGRWFASELVSQDPMGYGTYTWTIDGDFSSLPENVVVGLFTWDNDTFFEQANSEVDIEFSKWGASSMDNTLQYGVQPIFFSDFYEERKYNVPNVSEIIGLSTHQFHWTDSVITWRSFEGETTAASAQFAEWSFDLNNPERVKVEGGQSSQPIIIPAPGDNTNARINFWLLTYIDAGPTDGQEQEIVIRSFGYQPN